MPRSWYRERIATGAIGDADLEAALAASPHFVKPADLAASRRNRSRSTCARRAADDRRSRGGGFGPRLAALIADRIGLWAAGYFDEGQALWAAPKGRRPFTAWRAFATQDLRPSFMVSRASPPARRIGRMTRWQ